MTKWKKAFGEKMQKNIINNLLKKMQNSPSIFFSIKGDNSNY